MDVVYFFRESSHVRIPFFNYDKGLFRLLAAHGGGIWDEARREFVFAHDSNTGQFNRILPGVRELQVPCVWVEENSPVEVSGFWERPWGQPGFPSAGGGPAAFRAESGGASAKCSDTEKFPEGWRLKLESELRARKYSPKTRSAYIYFNRLLCNTLQKHPGEIHPEDITHFLAAIEKDKNYSASSMNLAISAIKFFHKRVLQKEVSPEQRRPRQDKRLPVVISKSEIAAMFKAEKNVKHRLLMMIVYASGLRVSEVVCLKRQDMDKYRKSITVVSGKGRKDRHTIMSEAVIGILDDYYAQYDTTRWLFPGTDPARHLSIRTAQRIFEQAVKRAQVEKCASIHSLRHSFATHLLESGTDIRYIKDLLGHSSIRTTERYTHVARHKISNIVSPLDTINNEEGY